MTIHSVLIQKLLSTNAHLGRRVAAHHFKVYTCGVRNAMTIIDSDKTLICLRNACHFIGNLVRQKGRFLFVNTNSLFDEIIEQMTKRIGCNNDNHWRLRGFLTNSGSPRKFRSRNKKFNLVTPHPPDCVVIMDTERKSSVILEADRLQIPIVGLVDSSMPWETYKRITYPVPANDSVQFVYLFCNLITKTFLFEQKRLASAMGPTAIEELTTDSDSEGEEEKDIKKSKIDSENDEIYVLPYESLLPILDDTTGPKKLLDKLVVLKFNGGLGTHMGYNGPRSAIEICNGLTCLDIIVNEIQSLNSKHGCNVPLILMNTSRTHDDTLKVLKKYSKKNIDIRTLSQGKGNSLNGGQTSEDEPFCNDQDVFLSLKNSGMLDDLLWQDKEYIFLVKSDNLVPAVDHHKILNHLILNRIEFCMEVISASVPNSEEAVHGSTGGKFQLSEIARTPVKYVNKSKSMEKFELIDTSNLWVNLKSMDRLVETDALNIDNYSVSEEVDVDEFLSQESADSSAAMFFDRTIGINVPHSRFFPMTTTSDLLLVRSDLYTCDEGILIRNKARINPINPSIDLGPEFEKVGNFQSRFKSIPSIIELDSLKVAGDVWFGTGITLKGKVSIIAKPGMRLEIPDGAVLENKEISDSGDI